MKDPVFQSQRAELALDVWNLMFSLKISVDSNQPISKKQLLQATAEEDQEEEAQMSCKWWLLL